MASNLEERVVRLLVFDDTGRPHSLEVSYSPAATAGALVHRFLTQAESAGDATTHVLVDPRSRAIIPADAPLSQAQLLHGQVLQVLPRQRAAVRERPVLADDDVVRLVVEIGPQIGMAWPLSVSRPAVRLDIEEGMGVLLASTAPEPAFVAVLDDAASGIEVSGAADRIRVDGVLVPGRHTSAVQPGSAIEILTDDAEDVLVLLRVVEADAHTASRPVSPVVRYRIVPSEHPAQDDAARSINLPGMPEFRMEKFSLTEFLLQQGPTLLMPLVFLGVVGPSPWLLAFAAYPIFMLGHQLYRRAKERDKHDTEVGNWRQTVDRTLAELRGAALGEAARRRRLHPLTRELVDLALYGREGLWTGEVGKDGSLFLAVGSGTYLSGSNATMPGDQTEGNLRDWRAYIDTQREVGETPFVIDLGRENVAIIGSGPRAGEAMAEVLLRLCLTHSTTSVALAALLPATGADLQRLSWVKWLPHFASPTDAFASERFVHGAERCNEALRDAIASVSDRGAQLVLLVHEACGVEIHLLEELIAAAEGNVSVLWYGVSAARVPDLVSRIVRVGAPTEAHALTARVSPAQDEIEITRHDENDSGELTGYATRLAAFVDETGSSVSAAIPTRVALGATLPLDPGDLSGSIATRWAGENAAESVIATLGVSATGTFDLDLAKHGPHTLIGGTTGSGKSELLRTLVLSLAVRYSPRELCFILIDYKGLAALGNFAPLPHQVGLVSNLEAADVRRVIDFLRKEIERRQLLLQDDQGEYVRYRERLRKRQASEADGPDAGVHLLPRLVVVIDEFAGFADADRHNIDAILNIAARGRSLGVHLILATQRPGTGIPREITANIDARFCLHTLDEQDSIAVLDTPDAAEIAKSLVGRAFVRLAAGSLQQLQVAWAQGDSLKRRAGASDLTISYFDPLLPKPSPKSDGEADDETTDFALALAAVEDAAARQSVGVGDRRYRRSSGVLLAAGCDQPVLAPALAKQLPVTGTDRPAGDDNERIAVGVRDEPQHQRQSIEHINFKAGGFLYVGSSLSGRTEILASIARRFQVRTGGRVVVVDGGDGSLAARLSEIAALAFTNPTRDQIEYLWEQLELKAEPNSEKVLVVIDRVDVIAAQPADAIRLAALTVNGPTGGVHFAASSDTRVPLEPALRNAFTWRYQGMGELPGRALAGDENVVQFFTRPPRSEVVAPPSGRRRPLGFPDPDLFSGRPDVPDNLIYLGVDELRHQHVGVSVRAGFTIAGGEMSGKTTTLLSLGDRISARLGKPVPLIAPYDVDSPAFVDVRAEVGEERLETLWLAEAAERWWSDGAANFLFIDDVTRVNSYFASPMNPMPFGPGEERVLDRYNVRLVVAGDIGVLGYGRMTNLNRIQSFSDRNFFILQPPGQLQVERYNVNIHWESVVRPRTWRSYGPGEGVLVTPSSRFDVRVRNTDNAVHAARSAQTERGAL